MNLDVTRDVDDFSAEVFLDLSRRIEKSHTAEQLVCRESELDEVWRLLDFAVSDAERGELARPELAHLRRLRALVIEAHDLIGVDCNVSAAASRLRESALAARRVDSPAGPSS